MKTEKIIASVIAAALGITTIIPIKLPEANAVSGDFYKPVFSADEDYSLGDVNNDKNIDASDASIILAEYSLTATGKDGTFSANQKKSADIDTNGLIDSADAALILSYYSYYSTGGKLDLLAYLVEQNILPAETTTTAPTTTNATKTTETVSSVKTTTATSSAKTTENTTVLPKTTSKPSVSTTVSAKTTTSTSKATSTTSTSATSTVTTANLNKVSSIKLDRTEVYIGVGYGMLSANVTMFPNTALNKNEIWTSSDESIAVVDGEGYVIGKSKGTCIITVTSADNPEVSAKVTAHIVDPSTVCAISLNQNEMSIKKGGEGYAAIVTMYPTSAKDKREKWSSSNEEIATVNEEGWITARKAGTCAITVQSVDNPAIFAIVIVTVYDGEPPVTTTSSTTTTTSATATTSTTTGQTSTTTSAETTSTVTVTTNVKVSEIILSDYELTIPVGQKRISIVTMLPYEAINKDEIWISSDETIATVDKYGWVKGISIGECTVTVYSVSNPEVKAEIAVKIVDAGEEVPEPNINFSHIIDNLSGNNYITFYTPFPKKAEGQYEIEYVITDAKGNSRTEKSSVLSLPTMKSVATRLTSETNNFTVTTYLTNLNTNGRAKIGEYQFTLSPRDAKTIMEDIYYAFYIIGGISE